MSREARPERLVGALGVDHAEATPRVSCVMAARNAAHTVTEAIESVRGQSNPDWELVVVDDASTDGTLDIARGHAAADRRIHVISVFGQEGAAAARNRALAAANGRYIAFLDADDLWHPEKLSRQVAFMERTQSALSFTGYVRRRQDAADVVVAVPAEVTYSQLLRGNVIGCLTAMYDVDRCGKSPMPDIRRRHDFALWLDIVRRTGPAHGLNEPLAVHRVNRGSLSANKLSATLDTWKMYREVVGLSRSQAFVCLASHLWRRATRKRTKVREADHDGPGFESGQVFDKAAKRAQIDTRR